MNDRPATQTSRGSRGTRRRNRPDWRDLIKRCQPEKVEHAQQETKPAAPGKTSGKTGPTTSETKTLHPNADDARDFLDRRDERRISHRLGRPFRF